MTFRTYFSPGNGDTTRRQTLETRVRSWPRFLPVSVRPCWCALQCASSLSRIPPAAVQQIRLRMVPTGLAATRKMPLGQNIYSSGLLVPAGASNKELARHVKYLQVERCGLKKKAAIKKGGPPTSEDACKLFLKMNEPFAVGCTGRNCHLRRQRQAIAER